MVVITPIKTIPPNNYSNGGTITPIKTIPPTTIFFDILIVMNFHPSKNCLNFIIDIVT